MTFSSISYIRILLCNLVALMIEKNKYDISLYKRIYDMAFFIENK